jgi:hypothetical protein
MACIKFLKVTFLSILQYATAVVNETQFRPKYIPFFCEQGTQFGASQTSGDKDDPK